MGRHWKCFAAAFCAVLVTSMGTAAAQESEQTKIVVTEGEEDWDIDAPIFLRSATPEEEGELAIKNIFSWHRERGDEETWEYEFEAEYGLMRDHELIFEVPFELAEGRVDGSGDITFGWHWRLWEEGECENCGASIPAFAMRNLIRIPSGVDSSGVDYTLRGLFTWSITPGKSRLHLNPFLKLVDGNNNDEEEFSFNALRSLRRGSLFRSRDQLFRHDNDEENVQWGTAVGMDYQLNEDMLFIWDYLWTSRQFDEDEDNHLLEFALEWEFAEDQKLAFATEVGLDGNDSGSQFGARIMYQFELK